MSVRQKEINDAALRALKYSELDELRSISEYGWLADLELPEHLDESDRTALLEAIRVEAKRVVKAVDYVTRGGLPT
jgi:hypothetical protein